MDKKGGHKRKISVAPQGYTPFGPSIEVETAFKKKGVAAAIPHKTLDDKTSYSNDNQGAGLGGTFSGLWQFITDEPWTNGLTIAVGSLSGIFLGSLLAPGAFTLLSTGLGGAALGGSVVYARWRILKQASDAKTNPACNGIWAHLADEPIKTLIVFMSGGLVVGILVRIAENYILGEAISYAVEGNILEVASLLGGGIVSVILEYAVHRWWSCDEHWWEAFYAALISFLGATKQAVKDTKQGFTDTADTLGEQTGVTVGEIFTAL